MKDQRRRVARDELPLIQRSQAAGYGSWSILAGLGLFMLVSYSILRGGWASVRGNETTADRAIFTIANAVSLSGFQLTVNPGDFELVGQVTIFLLMACGTLATLVVSGWALVRILNLDFSDDQIVRGSIISFVLAMLIGSAALLGEGTSLWTAVFQSAGAFCNCGLVLRQLPSWMDWRTQLVLLPLAVLGGFGIPVLLDLVQGITHGRRLHRHTTAALASSACVYLAGLGLVVLIELLDGANIRHAAVLGSTEAINSRTLGLPLQSLAGLSRASQWILLLLMSVGACSGGSGGGIKTNTLFVLARDVIRLLGGGIVTRIFAVACIWLTIYVVLVLATTIALLGCEVELTSDRALFIAVSAVSNVGTSHEPLSMVGPGLYILSAAMVFGRFLPLAILWWTAQQADDVEIAVA